MNKIYETIIVGAGMAGIGAAYKLIKMGHKTDDFLVIEYSEMVGGHFITLDTPDGPIDIGVQFGNKSYTKVLEVIKDEKLPITLVPMDIPFASGNENESVIYSNKRPKNKQLIEQCLKWNKLIKNGNIWWWKIISFGMWCKIYGFTTEFVEYCIKPGMSLLMAMDDIYSQSAVYPIEALRHMVQLINPTYDNTWTVYGGIQTLPVELVKKLNIPVNLNTELLSVTQEEQIYNLLIKNTKTGVTSNIYTKSIISATSAPVAINTLSKVINTRQRMYLERAIKCYKPFITILHQDETVMKNLEGNDIYYYYEKLGNSWRSVGKLSLGYFLSATEKMENLDYIKGPKRIITWNYPMMDTLDIIYFYMLNTNKIFNGNSKIQFAGGWSKISSMEGAFTSGIQAAEQL